MAYDNLLIDEEFLPEAIRLVKEAKRSISISTFKLEISTRPGGRQLLKFFELLFEKRRAGIIIKMLINGEGRRRSSPWTNVMAACFVLKNGIEIKSLKNGRCCHAKLLIVDDSAAIIGSHNLSVKSCHANFEVSYLTTDTTEILRLQSVFDKNWQRN